MRGRGRYSAGVSLEDEARTELEELERIGRRRGMRILEGAQGPVVIVDGVEVLNFASNDYLGLAGDPRLVRAAVASLEDDGVGAGASRLIVGNHRRHVELEAAVAAWMGYEGVRLFGSGYAANVGVLTALLREGALVFSDELNHASIIDGCRLAKAQIVVFPHRDLDALEIELRRSARRKVVVSESLFSMDGDVADVAGLARLCHAHGAALVVDEAHAVGVLGPEGRGVAAREGVVPDVLIGTFGKALGTFGAFAATTKAVADLLWNRARSLVFSTGMPPSVAAAAAAAIEIVRGPDGQARRDQLVSHGARLRELVPDLGGESAIAPLLVGDDRLAMELSARLFEARVFAQGIRPPTVPVGTARLRLSLNARHTTDHVEQTALSLSHCTRPSADGAALVGPQPRQRAAP